MFDTLRSVCSIIVLQAVFLYLKKKLLDGFSLHFLYKYQSYLKLQFQIVSFVLKNGISIRSRKQLNSPINEVPSTILIMRSIVCKLIFYINIL